MAWTREQALGETDSQDETKDRETVSSRVFLCHIFLLVITFSFFFLGRLADRPARAMAKRKRRKRSGGRGQVGHRLGQKGFPACSKPNLRPKTKEKEQEI